MGYTYLAINVFTIIIPLAWSFHPRYNFYKRWKSFIPAVLITGFCFLLWDSWFTSMGVWGFNPEYITGLNIFNMPVEEVLFFLCIPYACVFTFHCLGILSEKSFSKSTEDIITVILLLSLLISAIIWRQKIYSLITFTSLSVVLMICRYVLNIQWLGRFYITYSLLLLPFFIVDGILTGTGLEEAIVWYNEMGISGIRIATIPVEDIFYGMELILINILVWKKLDSIQLET